MYSSFARLAVDWLRAPNLLESTGTLDMLDDDYWSDSAPPSASTGGCGAPGQCSKVWFHESRSSMTSSLCHRLLINNDERERAWHDGQL
ncbi:MAG: hypothetical protein ACPIOQ_45135, partial [Promethearchaeia archaeon]